MLILFHENNGMENSSRAGQIENAALSLFLKNGFDATSMDKIAKAANVSKRTPYIYFKNKHDLFSAIILNFLSDLKMELEAVWSSRTGLKAIREGMQVYADFALKDVARFDLIMTFERRDYFPDRTHILTNHAAACQEINDHITLSFFNAVEQSQIKGELPRTLQANQLGLLIWSGFTGVLTLAAERQNLLEASYGWTTADMIAAYISSVTDNNNTRA